MIFHNFTWQGLTLPDDSAPAQPFDSGIKEVNQDAPAQAPVAVAEAPVIESPPIEVVDRSVIELETEKEIQEIKKEINIVVEETGIAPVEQEVLKPQYSDETKKWLDQKKIMIWCSPPVITEHIDHLYGDNHRTIEYTTKFSFEGIIVSQNDMELKFWAPIRITKNSIIFPRETGSGRKSRWWRVVHVEEKEGSLCSCILSDESLNFGE